MEKIQYFFRIIEFFYLSPKGIPSLSIINYQLSIQINPPFPNFLRYTFFAARIPFFGGKL